MKSVKFIVLRSLFFALILMGFIPALSARSDLWLDWGDDSEAEWQSNAARVRFFFNIWSGEAQDDYIVEKGDGEGLKVMYGGKVVFKANGFREGEAWKTHSLEFTEVPESGELYADHYDGSKYEWKKIEKGAIITWKSNGETDGDNRGYATLYWYPGSDCMGKSHNLKLTAKTKDSGNDYFSFDSKYEDFEMTPYSYGFETVDFQGYNVSNGTYPIKVKKFINGNKYKETKATVRLLTSVDGKNWYTQETKEWVNTDNVDYTFVNANYIKYPKGGSEEVGYKPFAEGVYFKLEQVFDPDKGSGSYTQDISRVERTPKVATLSSLELKVEQTDDNVLVFYWNAYVPTNCENNNWVLERKDGSTWVKIVDIKSVDGENIHRYKLDYMNKDKTETYRIRNTFFADGIWYEYMRSEEKKVTYSPYYKEFDRINSNLNSKQHRADISWSMKDKGIWNQDVLVWLEYYIKTDGNYVLVANYNLAYDKKSFTLQNLQSCSQYRVIVYAENNAVNFRDSIVTEFYIADAESHEISKFEATRGYYSNKVRLRWEVPKNNDFSYFEIKKSAINDGDNRVLVAQVAFNGNNTIYSYEDVNVDPGRIYNYYIEGYTNCQDSASSSESIGSSLDDYGFAQSYASVSGRVCFDGNQGAPGVDVAIISSVGYNENYSLRFNGTEAAYLELPGDVIDFRKDNQITIQAYVYPTEAKSDTSYLFAHRGIFEIGLVKLDSVSYGLISNFLSDQIFDTLKVSEWQHLSWSIALDKDAKTADLSYYRDGVLKRHNGSFAISKLDSLQHQRDSLFYVGAYHDKTKNFAGYIDEIRVWNTVLDSYIIARDYNRYISGREEDLRAYYRCNEDGINRLFDQSGRDEQFNKRDGVLGMGVEHSAVIIPSSEQLANKATTDANGNYIINTIPYNTEGIQYDVVPLLGVHKFNPSNKPIFVSPQSSVFNNVDFTDVSSFEVSGKVYYENSDYPVAGCQLKVDGVTCIFNEKPVLTDENGEFTIKVPIGEHYIQVVREGHTFENGGRYPADPNGEGVKFNFDRPVNNMIFTDVTKATIVGRVSGGPNETKKLYGGRSSKNNIGVAEIVLEAPELYSINMIKEVNETATRFEVNPDTIVCSNASSAIDSKAYIGGGEQSNLITIYTDTITGEFAVEVPPIQYKVRSITIPSNADISFDLGAIKDIDARNVQSLINDTTFIAVDSIPYMKVLSYVDDLNVTYRSKPVFKVNQRNCGDSVYGEETYRYIDEILKDTTYIELYSVDSLTDKVSYTFDAPIFEQGEEYTFSIEAYEEYVNRDIPNDAVVEKVPLQHAIIDITNEFSTEQAVDTATAKLWPELAVNQLLLDTAGKAEYTFTVGFPNLAEPYTYGVNMVYNVDGEKYQWREEPLEAIILGHIQGGNQFVTGGPDVVTMILRDPPGSQSYSYFEKGTKSISQFTANPSIAFGGNFNFARRRKVKYEVKTGSWFGVGGGTYVQIMDQKYEGGTDKDHNIGVNVSGNYTHNEITTMVENKRVATSSTIGYIGSAGDVFIGSSTNLLFGEAREVVIERDSSSGYKVVVRDAIAVGEQFTTAYQYSQSYIESTMIPDLKKLRNSFLVTVADTAAIISTATDEPAYVTMLDATDPKFGQEGTYKVVYPDKDTWGQTDTISVINGKITDWIEILKLNEQEKVEAINRSYGQDIEDFTAIEKKNYSFDSGTTITDVVQHSSDKTNSGGGNVSVPYKYNRSYGGKLRNTALGITLAINLTPSLAVSGGDTEGSTTTTGFVLADADLNNAYTIDVITTTEIGRSPIFYTRGGQTSCPHADVEKTKYFEPGKHNLAEATVQIEVPQIRVENARAINVPVGEAATYKLLLDNLSETDTDLFFDLCVLDESNPNGARIAMDGEALVGNRAIRVKSGETMEKTIRLLQTNQGVLEYDSIALVLKSQCQGGLAFPKIIADTVYIHASFIPSCSDITLQIENQVLNTSVKGAILPIVVKDYNINYTSLKGIRLQYKAERDNDWSLLGEWLLNTAGNEEAQLLNTSEIKYNFDMSDNAFFPDGNYQFRAVTICTGDVYNESEVVTVIKDVTRPALFGTPLPANGILGVSGEISVMFNEDIKASQLTETRNFIVEGRLNGYKVDHSVAMQLFDSVRVSTEANFSIDKAPFAINLWLNYTESGDIISFGSAKGKFVVGVNEAQQFAVSTGDTVYSSTAILPKDKWVFLSVMYDTIDGGHIYANYAVDASSVELLDVAIVGIYKGRGIMTLGGGLTAAIHDLSLWNYARQWEEAQSGMYDSKSASSVGLVGYWRMDEGFGSVCEDIARGRHIILANDNAWHFENENIAVALDGKTAMSMNISMASPKPTDDYMLELWFRGGEQNKGAILLSNGNDFKVGFDAEGNVLMHNAQCTMRNYLDNQWHHLAINYLYNGMTTIYFDGEVVGQMPIASMPNIASDHLIIGAERYKENDSTLQWSYRNFFAGDVDEIRLWKATVTADYIRHQYRTRMYGDEEGLVAYYPFEKTTLDDFAQPVVNLDYIDFVTDSLSIELVSNVASSDVKLEKASVAPALKEIYLLENVEYSFVASDRKIIIDIDEEADIIEGTTIQLTVRNVEDLNGNVANPISWTVFVNRNQLKWMNKEFEATMTVAVPYNFTAKMLNASGQTEIWQLLNLPSWLSVDAEYGELAPLATQELSFTISETLPIGNYEETIYLVGNNNVYEPFVVKVAVEGYKPNWKVDPADFEHSMSIIGQLRVDNVLSEDENDIVGAFIGEQCVGIASPIYNARYDAYYVMLDVYSNTLNAEVDFKVYDASTGNTYVRVETLVPDAIVKFENNRILGNMTNPLRWNTLNYLEQQIDLQKGWTWISFYVDVNGKYVKDILPKKIENPIIAFKNRNYISLIQGDTIVNDFELNVQDSYLAKSKVRAKFNVVGDKVNPKDVEMTINSGWSWIGYPLLFNTSITDAFADLVPLTGDVVRSQTNFAIYDGYEWIGTLKVLESGKGYKYKSSSSDSRTFTYPSVDVNKQASIRVNATPRDTHFKPIDNAAFPNNMAILAKVYNGEELVMDAEVAAFVGGECRTTVFADENGYVCLTIPGEGQGDVITLKVKVGENIYDVDQTIIYKDDDIVGSISEPYRIQIGENTALDNGVITSVTIYTKDGQLYVEGADLAYKVFDAVGRLIYIGSSEAISLPRGVYMIQLGDETQKVVL